MLCGCDVFVSCCLLCCFLLGVVWCLVVYCGKCLCCSVLLFVLHCVLRIFAYRSVVCCVVFCV